MRAIKHIHQWVSDEKTRNNYWNTVFYLQDIDGEFIKVWNDFNFYENKLLKKEADLDYYILVKNYIYIKVYYTYKKILKKSIWQDISFYKENLGQHELHVCSTGDDIAALVEIELTYENGRVTEEEISEITVKEYIKKHSIDCSK